MRCYREAIIRLEAAWRLHLACAVKPPAGPPWSVTDDDDRRQRAKQYCPLLCCRASSEPPLPFPILGHRWTKKQRGWEVTVSLDIVNLAELNLHPRPCPLYILFLCWKGTLISQPTNQPSAVCYSHITVQTLVVCVCVYYVHTSGHKLTYTHGQQQWIRSDVPKLSQKVQNLKRRNRVADVVFSDVELPCYCTVNLESWTLCSYWWESWFMMRRKHVFTTLIIFIHRR